MASFYKRHSLQYRFSLMFSVTSLAGAFSGLLAAAIQEMAGDRGKDGWAWIFILVCLSHSFLPLHRYHFFANTLTRLFFFSLPILYLNPGAQPVTPQ